MLGDVLLLLHPETTLPPLPAMLSCVWSFLSGAETDSAVHALDWNGIDTDDDFRLVLPLLGGLTEGEVGTVLPRIVRLLSADVDGLKTALARLVKTRPPVMSKCALLVGLHR